MLYPKIHSPYTRYANNPGDPMRNKLKIGDWARPEFGILRGLDWEWTEKVDGTNVRVIWDGYKVCFGGRTEAAQMPIKLLDALNPMFPEELMEQQFGVNPATLYGEGYGPGVQNGGNYRRDMSFVLFDVAVWDATKGMHWWLLRDNVIEVSKGLGIGVVPLALCADVATAIDYVTSGVKSQWGDFPAEGLVGKPPLGITGRDGDRLMMKIKTKDFR